MKDALIYKLLTNDNETDFTLSEYGFEDFKYRESYYRPMKHSNHILHFINRGKGVFILNKNKYPLGANDIFYFPPDTPVNYYKNDSDPYSYFWIAFNGNNAINIIKSIGLSEENPIKKIDRPDDVFQCLTQLIEPEAISVYKIKSLVYNIFDLIKDINTYATKTNMLTPKEQTVMQIKNYIKNNYSFYDLRITHIADFVHISTAYLYKIFAEVTGASVKNYLIAHRMKKAYELLKDGNNVSHTAFSVGYKDIYHFSKQFKLHFGMSPSDVKNSQS